jgi:hypothetical protein
LPSAPTSISYVDGHSREIWRNPGGEIVVECYVITDMGHGAPLGRARDGERYGAEGAFLIEAGISSSYHIANFFHLTQRTDKPKAISKDSIDNDVKGTVVARRARVPRSEAKTIGTLAKPTRSSKPR